MRFSWAKPGVESGRILLQRSVRVDGGSRFGRRRFRDAEYVFVGDFKPRRFLFSALRKMLLDENGLPGVQNERSGSGKPKVAGTVMSLDTFPNHGRVAFHALKFLREALQRQWYPSLSTIIVSIITCIDYRDVPANRPRRRAKRGRIRRDGERVRSARRAHGCGRPA